MELDESTQTKSRFGEEKAASRLGFSRSEYLRRAESILDELRELRYPNLTFLEQSMNEIRK